MNIEDLKTRILNLAGSKYPCMATTNELECEEIEYTRDELVIALKELENDGLLKDTIHISCDNMISITGNLELTKKGYQLLKSK